MGMFIFWTGPAQQDEFLNALGVKVRLLQGHVFAPSTRLTYASPRNLYLQFCILAGLSPVPLSHSNTCRCIAFISQKLAFDSIQQYINVARITHLETGHDYPFHNSWHIDTLQKGAKRVLGVLQKQELPITPYILHQMFTVVDFSAPLEVTFCASCLVAFSSFFRKSNILVKNVESFNPHLHVPQGCDLSLDGVTLVVRWSKTIRYRQRSLYIPLPHIQDPPQFTHNPDFVFVYLRLYVYTWLSYRA